MASNPKNRRNSKTPAPAHLERIGRVMQLHTAGLDYAQIAAQVGCSRSTAHRDVQAGIRLYLADHDTAAASTLMELQLLSAIRAIWAKVLQGDIAAGNLLVRYQARWAALTGADAPTRVTVNVVEEGAVDAAIAALTEELSRLGDGTPVPAE